VSFAKRYWLIPIGCKNSSRRIFPGLTGDIFFIIQIPFLVIIYNFNLIGITIFPDKTDAPLIINLNAMLIFWRLSDPILLLSHKNYTNMAWSHIEAAIPTW